MKRNPFPFCLFSIYLILTTISCFAKDIKPMVEFSPEDRVLILAPHPDDETIAAGGAIQKALKARAKVKLLFLTCGEHNEPAFIVYEKRLTIRQGEFVHMGEVRKKEAIEAIEVLGLTEKDCAFLGYPDSGTMEILLKYWGKTKPFKDFLTRISKVPYAYTLSPGAPYVGENILNDIKKVIKDFRPTKIFVSHPADTNRDHRSLYLFSHIALWDLEGEMKMPEIFSYIVHIVGWPKPRGYHPDLELAPPDMLKAIGISWRRLELTEEEVKAKHDAIICFKSQNEYNPPYLLSFARSNELFDDYPVVKISKDYAWSDAKMAHDIGKGQTHITGLAYARKGDGLFIRLVLKRRLYKELGLSILLLGYRRDLDFSKMPKINISIGLNGLSIKDKRQKIDQKKIQLTEEGNILILKIPLSILGDPVYVMACAKARIGGLPFEDTAWHIIQFE